MVSLILGGEHITESKCGFAAPESPEQKVIRRMRRRSNGIFRAWSDQETRGQK